MRNVWNIFASSWNFLFYLAFFVGATYNLIETGINLVSVLLALFGTVAFLIVTANLIFRIVDMKPQK